MTTSTPGVPASKLRALELGATEFLAKPVDASELRIRVRNSLAFKVYQGPPIGVPLYCATRSGLPRNGV